MSTTHFDDVRAEAQSLRVPAWIWPALGTFALLLAFGHQLLNDPDTYWQIAVGQWIFANDAFPRTDVFSFTMKDQPWISTSWLAQVAFATMSRMFGWSGVVVLTALSAAAAIGMLTRFLMQRIAAMPAVILSLAALILVMPHLGARPHALALPIMVFWASQLIDAADRHDAPSLWLLPVLTLWANVHGSFIAGLAFTVAMAVDAVWNADASERRALAVRWPKFAFFAMLACCVTPYAWGTLLAALKILTLGDALPMIIEWRPADFGKFSGFEVILLGAVALSLWRGITLPPLRLMLLLGLLHLALSSVRHADVLAMLAPMLIAYPLAAYVGRPELRARDGVVSLMLQSGAVVLLIAFVIVTLATRSYVPPQQITPVEAIAALKKQNAQRVFNDYGFGGYMIASGVAPFIDGRTELYGTRMMLSHDRAVSLSEPAELFALLDKYKIDATLLSVATPAAKLLDRTEGWQRLFIDDVAVVHVRKLVAPMAQPAMSVPAKGKAK